MKNLYGLIDACCQARENANLRPEDGETYCNVAVAFIALRIGCNELSGRLANDMCDYFEASPDKWSHVPIDKAQDLANAGSLVVAYERSDPHGHVCVIFPGIQKTSGKWNCQTPACINVGRDVFIGKGLNYAFKEIPKLVVWRDSL
jgi:hypothetical protein